MFASIVNETYNGKLCSSVVALYTIHCGVAQPFFLGMPLWVHNCLRAGHQIYKNTNR